MLIVGAESYKVSCDYTTPVCTCPLNNDDDTCEFQLIIQELETFTRYEVTGDGTSIDTNGRVWYINSTTGELLPREEPTTNNICKNITEESTACTQPFTVDGKSNRLFIAINGRAPGPTLIVNKDQYIVVNVINKLISNTSIHWHGMHQKNSHWMDGVEHVTQYGIPPDGSFTYIFQAIQTGTHWYHSHSEDERSRGLFGALIVKEQQDELIEQVQYDLGYSFEDMPEQHTLTFLDWQDQDEPDKKDTFSPDGAEVSAIVYWSGIINGKGRHQEVPYTETRLSIFTVSSDNTYRFRLIGAQSIFAYCVSVDEHKLIVIATDGALVEPMEVDYIIIHSGERYDFLLNTKTHSEINRENFMIRADTLEVEPHFAEAILHYDTGSNVEPKSIQYESIKDSSIPVSSRCTETSHCSVLNCPFKEYNSSYNVDCIHIHQLKLMFPEPDNNLPDVQVGEADKLFFNFGFEGPKGSSSMNARNMKVLPSYPLSLSVGNTNRVQRINEEECKGIENSTVCDDNSIDNADECACVHIRKIEKDLSIQMVLSTVLPNETDTPERLKRINAHPVHLHGHYFHVVDIQFGEYNEDGVLENTNKDINCGGTNNCNNPNWKNTTVDYAYGRKGKINRKAPLKDTLLIPAGGYAVVYFKANNPGYWFLHCHIEPHVLGGMSAVIAEEVSMATSPPEKMLKYGNFSFSVEQFKKARGDETENSGWWTYKRIKNGLIAVSAVASIFIFISIVLAVIVTVLCCCYVDCCCCFKEKRECKESRKRKNYERVD